MTHTIAESSMVDFSLEGRQKEASKQSTKAARIFLDSRAIAIVGDLDEHDELFGSGIGLVVNDHWFVLTVGHVLDRIQAEGRNTILIGEGQPSVEVHEYLDHAFLNNDDIDVGWMQLSVSEAQKLGKEFIPLDRCRCGVDHAPDDAFIISGYPDALRRSENVGEWQRHRLRPICFSTATIPPATFKIDAFVGRDIIVQYPSKGIGEDGRIIDIPSAECISGGSIWKLGINTPGIWSTSRIELVGIAHSWNREEGYVRGHQIHSSLRFLAESKSQVADTVHQHILNDKERE